MKPQTVWLVVAIVVIIVAIVVFLVVGGTKTSTSPAATTNQQSLGAQIYTNVAPQAAVPQSLPQTNPFGQ